MGAVLLLIRTVTPLSVAGYGGVPAWVLLASPVPYSEMNWPGAIGFPGGAELAALTTPNGFRKTPVPLSAGAFTPKYTSYAFGSSLCMEAPTNSLPAAPNPTMDNSAVPVPSAFSV